MLCLTAMLTWILMLIAILRETPKNAPKMHLSTLLEAIRYCIIEETTEQLKKRVGK